MKKRFFWILCTISNPILFNAQKLPKGMDKAIAAQEKARIATEKVAYAKGRRNKDQTNYSKFGDESGKKSNQAATNRDILRRINERINSNMSQQKPITNTKKSNSTDFEFGSSKKAISNDKKN